MQGHWSYPLRRGQTLVSHEWVEWHTHAMLRSRFLAVALHQGRRQDVATAMILWAESFRQDPAGTLPDDDVELAALARYGGDAEGWAAARPLALYGWQPCAVEGCEDGDGPPRLGHPFIATIAVRAVAQRERRHLGQRAAQAAVQRSRVRKQLGALGAASLARRDDMVAAVAEWLSQRGLFITPDNLRAALEALGVPRVVRLRDGASGGDQDM